MRKKQSVISALAALGLSALVQPASLGTAAQISAHTANGLAAVTGKSTFILIGHGSGGHSGGHARGGGHGGHGGGHGGEGGHGGGGGGGDVAGQLSYGSLGVVGGGVGSPGSYGSWGFGESGPVRQSFVDGRSTGGNRSVEPRFIDKGGIREHRFLHRRFFGGGDWDDWGYDDGSYSCNCFIYGDDLGYCEARCVY